MATATRFEPKDRTRREHLGGVRRVRFADPDRQFVILELTDGASVMGNADASAFVAGQLYRFHGRWADGKFGPEFKFETFVKDVPLTQSAVVKYLSETCKGVGKVTAERLWTKYGSDAVRVLREQPLDVANAGILSRDNAEEAGRDLERFAHSERTKVELFGLFAGKGFRSEVIDRAIGQWGVRAPAMIRKNPFRLLLRRLPGCGFKKCDNLFLELGLSKDRLVRQCAAAWNAIREDRSGSTWADAQTVFDAVLAAIPDAEPTKALRYLIRGGWIRLRRNGSSRYVAVRERADAEQRIADNVRRLMRYPSLWPTEVLTSQSGNDGLPSEHQGEQLRRATAGAVGCFVGGPGTGKTHTLGFLLKQVVAEHGAQAVAVCAPTGKAAVRAGESLKARNLSIPATTIHSLLEIGRNGHDGDGWGFIRNRGNPLDVRFVVIDESSMIDTGLMADLLDAIPDGACVLGVGDSFQLAPVGHGAPLRDLLASATPQGELTEVRRNSGTIVRACHEIKAGTPVTFDDDFDLDAPAPKNLRILDCPQSDSLDVLADVLSGMSRFDAAWECQIITALNEKSDLSRTKLNERFGKVLNPDGHSHPKNPFRVGDKIICLRNTRLKAVEPIASRFRDPAAALDAGNYQPLRGITRERDQAEQYVANGEIGRVVAVSEKATIARFGGASVPLVTIANKAKRAAQEEAVDAEAGASSDFDLAWAITVHRCVHPDTLVESEEGLLPIRILTDAGGCVATPHGDGRVYTKKIVNPVGPSIKLTTKHGYTITVTPEHRVEKWAGEEYQMCYARELQAGDWLRVRLGATVEPPMIATLPRRPETDVRAVRHRIPTRMTAEVAEFFGLMVADGTVFDRGFRLVKRHRDVALRFGELCQSLFGAVLHPVTNGKATGFEVLSTELATWLVSVGGMAPNAKAVPECVLRSRSSIHAAFLRGLFEDGTVNLQDGRCDHIEWGTVYPEMARVVQVMLLRLGVISTVKWGDRYTPLYVYGRSAAAFRDRVGFVSEVKRSRLVECVETEVKYTLPVSWDQAGEVAVACPYTTVQNARARGTVSRETARAAGWNDRLDWFEDPIVSVEHGESESMCIEVPDGHRFLQNGFPFWNSQGSEWPCVIVMVDDAGSQIADRNYWYTAISRARTACVVIGPKTVFDRQVKRVSLNRRRTFLPELLKAS